MARRLAKYAFALHLYRVHHIQDDNLHRYYHITALSEEDAIYRLTHRLTIWEHTSGWVAQLVKQQGEQRNDRNS